MSLKKDQNEFFGAQLAGASLAVVASVPLAAWLGSCFGDTYNSRVAIYGGLLLWAIIGAVSIYFITRNGAARFSAVRLLLWFVSTWLWPIPVAMWWLKKTKR